ncbi:MAG: hypothetical protein U0793_04575 [Gemmataceae bacterium]
MARFLQFLTAAALAALLLGALSDPAQAQKMEAASIKFTNRTSKPLIVQGVSVVGGMYRKGQMIYVLPGKHVWENSVPAGLRQYRIFDGSQPSRILNPSVRVEVGEADLHFQLVPSKTGGVDLLPAPASP